MQTRKVHSQSSNPYGWEKGSRTWARNLYNKYAFPMISLQPPQNKRVKGGDNTSQSWRVARKSPPRSFGMRPWTESRAYRLHLPASMIYLHYWKSSDVYNKQRWVKDLDATAFLESYYGWQHHGWRRPFGPLLSSLPYGQTNPCMVVAYKRGDHTLCQNHRSLLVSSSLQLGKCLHNVWRARTQPFMYKGATDMQFTAQPHALVAQTAHCVRLFQRSQIHAGRSCYVLFLDIQAAYYRLLRQHSIDSDFTDESLALFLKRMGISDLSIPDLAEILQNPNALDELQCPQHLKRVVSALHQSTWWRLDFDSTLVRTERGTRPGDGFADVIWQLCFSRFLHKVDSCLQSLGIQCALPWNNLYGFAASPGVALAQWYGLMTLLSWAQQIHRTKSWPNYRSPLK